MLSSVCRHSRTYFLASSGEDTEYVVPEAGGQAGMNTAEKMLFDGGRASKESSDQQDLRV